MFEALKIRTVYTKYELTNAAQLQLYRLKQHRYTNLIVLLIFLNHVTNMWDPLPKAISQLLRPPSINVGMSQAQCISHQATLRQPFCTGHTKASWDVAL